MKEILLVLMEALVHEKKCLVLILVKQTQSFAWETNNYYQHNSYLFVNGKADNKNVNFSSQFCLGSHCVKSVHIRSYSGPYFPAFGLNTERYGVSFRIQSECRKIWARITPNMETFQTVSISNGFSNTESRELSLNGNVYDFSIDYNFLTNLKYWKFRSI